FVSGGPRAVKVERGPFRPFPREGYCLRLLCRRSFLLPPSVQGERAPVVIGPGNDNVSFELLPEDGKVFGLLLVMASSSFGVSEEECPGSVVIKVAS
ncbi:MAG TPA: hypothetical protein PKJ17_03935, partial [Syntrophorhabdaceae bacterium]|nr:hypothetical protein [Syntrophorhabdaceae bacterium]